MAKSIMIQGTMSNAGKSLLVTGLCRILRQDGYRVAPFKSQNMALNSYVTRENLEMGRAQVVQAEACGIEPSVCMNPILLKPTTDMGSQVIVNGEVVGDMRAVDYFRKKKEYLPVIRQAYQKLDEQYDIIVIEGAGSPAEINLKQDDIVNMGMARLADAPVLLVGDIDRGGVFAQLVGTVMLLEKEEQDRIKGRIINKFRGDQKILEPGLSMLREKCGKPVLGVVPYLDVEIEEEDSLAESLGRREKGENIDLAVIRLPKISNFTDFQPLLLEPSLSVRYVDRVSELGSPDVVILPGTKSTMSDMRWLRESGLEAAIVRLVGAGTIVFGICGGYQMLGTRIEDACGAEGDGSMRGMGLLPIRTVFETSKTRTRMEGRTGKLSGRFESLSDKKVSGYEIHMGSSHLTDLRSGSLIHMSSCEENPSRNVPQEKPDGCCKGNAIGTYLHGIFDEEEFREAFVSLLHDAKGLDYTAGVSRSYREYKEKQYDRLAEALRESLDMEQITRIIQEGA
ncbi:MAG: cobyric acid synthase [Lachnospiraceae bacterium]|nr:cobyric acid synthase [Lachnospiraceae bacterium]